MLYTLTNGATSTFANVKVCQDHCIGYEFLNKMATMLTRTAAIIPVALLMTS